MEFGLGDHGCLESLGHLAYLLSTGICRTEGRGSCHYPFLFSLGSSRQRWRDRCCRTPRTRCKSLPRLWAAQWAWGWWHGARELRPTWCDEDLDSPETPDPPSAEAVCIPLPFQGCRSSVGEE